MGSTRFFTSIFSLGPTRLSWYPSEKKKSGSKKVTYGTRFGEGGEGQKLFGQCPFERTTFQKYHQSWRYVAGGQAPTGSRMFNPGILQSPGIKISR